MRLRSITEYLRVLEQQQRDNSRWKSESLNPTWYQGLSAHCATEDQVDRAHRQPTAHAEICQRLHKKKKICNLSLMQKVQCYVDSYLAQTPHLQYSRCCRTVMKNELKLCVINKIRRRHINGPTCIYTSTTYIIA